MFRENVKLKDEIVSLKRKIWKLEKRKLRQGNSVSSPSPNTKVARIVGGQFTNNNVRRELFAGAVLEKEVKQVVASVGRRFTMKKDVLSIILDGQIEKKYKLLGRFKGLFIQGSKSRNCDAKSASNFGKKKRKRKVVY